MPLYRTPLVDKAQPIVFVEGRDAGCATPYFQRTLAAISTGADNGAAVAADVSTKVDKGTSTGWSAATGTASKASFATYTAPTISTPPTQAEVQAIANHLQVLSQHMKAVVDGLLTSQTFT